SRPGLPADWMEPAPDDPRAWLPCSVEPGDLDVMPWQPRRQPVTLVLPWSTRLSRTAGQLGLIASLAVLTLLACRRADRFLAACRQPARQPVARIAALALAVPA